MEDYQVAAFCKEGLSRNLRKDLKKNNCCIEVLLLKKVLQTDNRVYQFLFDQPLISGLLFYCRSNLLMIFSYNFFLLFLP